MKLIALLIAASALTLGGCATTPGSEKVAGAPVEETYVPLGSFIPKKTSTRDSKQTVDMQSLENARTMGNGAINGGK